MLLVTVKKWIEPVQLAGTCWWHPPDGLSAATKNRQLGGVGTGRHKAALFATVENIITG